MKLQIVTKYIATMLFQNVVKPLGGLNYDLCSVIVSEVWSTVYFVISRMEHVFSLSAL